MANASLLMGKHTLHQQQPHHLLLQQQQVDNEWPQQHLLDFTKLSLATEERQLAWEQDNKHTQRYQSIVEHLQQHTSGKSTPCRASPVPSETYKHLEEQDVFSRSSPIIPQAEEVSVYSTKSEDLLREENLEMKSIFTQFASKSEDVTGLPEPVQLVLKLILLETNVQEKDTHLYNLKQSLKKSEHNLAKTKEEYEDKLAAQVRETDFLKEKIEYKANLEASMKNRCKESNTNDENEVEKLYKKIESLKEKNRQLDENNAKKGENIKSLQGDLSTAQQDANSLREMVQNHQQADKSRKQELERLVTLEREGMERERQDRYLLLVEQNKLKHKVEKLNDNCKSYQMKNEELCRIQNELEQECDQFRKLKKMIQEHGLPNHEQLILLQQQTEMFKDDVLNERKDRERAQAQREKMRRDLEILQSRNQSLQEQVYKYQEHIMRLNTGDRRMNQEFLQMGHQVTRYKPATHPTATVNNWENNPNDQKVKFSRQFSSPAYFNPKIRMTADPSFKPAMTTDPSFKPAIQPNLNGPVSPINNGRVESPDRMVDPRKRPQSDGYTQWKGRRVPAPRSPLLGANGDPWITPSPPGINPPYQQEGMYMNNIWCEPTNTSKWRFNNCAGEDNWSSGEASQDSKDEDDAKKGAYQEIKSGYQGDVKSGYQGDKGGYQCGKCTIKFTDTDTFRRHVEKCFN